MVTGPYRRESIGAPNRPPTERRERAHRTAATPRRPPGRGCRRRTGRGRPVRPATRLIASTSAVGLAEDDDRAASRPAGGRSGRRGASRPAAIAGAIERFATATRHGPRSRSRERRRSATLRGRDEAPPPGGASVRSPASRSGGSAGNPGLLLAAGRLPGGVDLVDHVEQLLRLGEVGRGLDLADLLVGVPEQLVQVRDLLEVLRLEVVVPEDVEVVLDEVGALLLDRDRAGR